MNAGPLEKALPKTGNWLCEPKYNGWRALVHVPSGTMFNRKGQRLSISSEFACALAKLKDTPFEWLDCEALERRHRIGRGALTVLDCIVNGAYAERRRHLEEVFGHQAELSPFELCGENEIRIPVVSSAPFEFWTELQQANQVLGCDFYEGIVAKRADSVYPIQLLSPEKEFPFWMKHRWHF